jgi:hypothetical protein
MGNNDCQENCPQGENCQDELFTNRPKSGAWLNKTRLKRLPVISREHFRKTRTIYFYKHLLSISNTNLQNVISNTSALKRRLVFRVPIGTLGADWYFECQLVLWVPVVTLNADCYFGCRLLL